jgi:pimeloyl-ACP methyl ester carboxylesterase
MLHGLVTGNMAGWYFHFGLPLASSREVLLYDQRGHGESSLADGGGKTRFDLESQTADLDAVLQHYGHAQEPVDLVGHSMGALIALHFALHQPQRVRRLVLVDAPMPARQYAGPSLMGVTTVNQIADFVASQVPAGTAGRRQERQRRRLLALFNDSTLIDDVLAMGAESDEDLMSLHVPVLLVYGQRSPCAAVGHHLRQRLPRAQLELLDCGHYVPEESPAALRTLIEKFLATEASQ